MTKKIKPTDKFVPIEEMPPGTVLTFIHPKYLSFYTGIVQKIIHHNDTHKSISIKLKIAQDNTITIPHSNVKYTYPLKE